MKEETKKKENKRKETALHYAALGGGNEKIVTSLLSAFGKEENTDKLIKYWMKQNKFKETALHYAAVKGNEKIVNSLLSAFKKEETDAKLIEYLMKEDADKETALHHASDQENEKIINSLLSAVSKEENKDKLIEYLIKEDKNKQTALHYALAKGNDILPILKSLLRAFSKKENKDKLIEYLIPIVNSLLSGLYEENTTIHYASVKEMKPMANCFYLIFHEEKNELIEYLKKEDKCEQTDLLYANVNENKKPENSLLTTSVEKERKKRLIEHLMTHKTPKFAKKDEEILVFLLVTLRCEKNKELFSEYCLMEEHNYKKELNDRQLHDTYNTVLSNVLDEENAQTIFSE
jgi:hypothetical protein